MADERFPIQHGPSVPWEFMVPHDAQCKKNHSGQSLQHIAGRGGLGATEAWCCVNGLALWPTHDTKEGTAAARQKWFELAERVNREWSVKQTRAEVLASMSRHRLDMDEGLCACGWESKGETWAEHILSLQPAAKDLEELLREEREKADLALVESLKHMIRWLLVAYWSLARVGWEEGPTMDEAGKQMLDVLCNLGYEPESKEAKQLLERTPNYNPLEKARAILEKG